MQRRAEARSARRCRLHVPARLDQRVERPHGLRHLTVEQPLPQAVARDRHPLGPDPAEELGQHLRGERNERAPRHRGPRHRREPRLAPLPDPPQRLEKLRQRRGVAMQHAEGIAYPLHVEPGDRPPRAADEEELSPGRRHRLLSTFTPLRIAFARLPASGMSASSSGPSGEVAQASDLAPRQPGELHRGPAHVADEPVGPGPAEQHPLRRQPRLLRAARHVELQAGLALHLVAEGRPVRGLAHRRRRHRDQPRQLHPRGERGEPAQRRQRPRPALRTEPPGRAQPGAEPAEHLLVVEIGRAARYAVEDDEAHGVRADVDHPDALQPCRRPAVETKLGHVTDRLGRHFACSRWPKVRPSRIRAPGRQPARQSWPCTSWITPRAPARPRPDSDGFSMKKRWQEKRCSPGAGSWRR